MSQKSSDPQAISFVSQPLKRDSYQPEGAKGAAARTEYPTLPAQTAIRGLS